MLAYLARIANPRQRIIVLRCLRRFAIGAFQWHGLQNRTRREGVNGTDCNRGPLQRSELGETKSAPAVKR